MNDEPGHGVSIIVFEDALHQVKSMVAADEWFKQRNRPVEFVVVSKSATRIVPLSGEVESTHAMSLAGAIGKCRYEQIAVLDSIYHFQAAHWNLIDPQTNRPAFRSWSFSLTRAPGSRRLLARLHALITRRLLRVRKNRLTPGIVTFTKSQLSSIDLMRLDPKSPDATTQLLALAKSQGLPVEEIRHCTRQPNVHWNTTNSGEPHFPKSRSLKRSIRKTLQFWFSELAFPARKSPEVSNAKLNWLSFAGVGATLLLAAILLFTNSNYPLFEPDEARNAQLAMNIVETGDWMSLSLFGEPYLDKPPLLTWLTAVSYKVFGFSAWATRLPSLIASFSLFGFLMLAGSKLVGLRKAVLGSAALLVAWGFVFQSRYVTTDPLLTLCTTVALLGIAVAVQRTNQKSQRSRWSFVAGVALGLGAITKGPVCAVITIPPLALWLLLNRDVSSKEIRHVLKAVLIPAILISAPWYLLIMLQNPSFLWHFLWEHHVVRFSDAFNHQEPFWFYLPIGWLIMFPASIFLPRVIRSMTSKKRKYRSVRTPVDGLLMISSMWTIGFFSMSDCKLPAYILPAVPMLALLIGVVLDTDLNRLVGMRTRLDRLSKRIAIGVCVLSAVAFVVGWRLGYPSLAAVMIAAMTVIVSLLLAVTFSVKRSTSRPTSWLATFGIAFLFVCLGVNVLIPVIAHNRSILQSIATDSDSDSTPVVYFGRDSFAASMYLPNRTVVQFDEESLSRTKGWLEKNPRALIVASDENVDRIRGAFGESASVRKTKTRHTFHISVYPERFATRQDADSARK